jgi:uncharacterized membrane protein
MDVMTRWIHLLALATYFGSTLALALVFLPAAAAVDDAAVQRRVLARGLRPYNVISFAALLALLSTGFSAGTDLKAQLGPEFARLLWPLAAKLALTFVLIIFVASYLSFGLAHRLVRAELGQLPVEAEKQAGMIRRMRSAAWFGCALVAWITWISLGLPH